MLANRIMIGAALGAPRHGRPLRHADDVGSASSGTGWSEFDWNPGADHVLPGLHVRFGAGHTIGQQFVIIETVQGRYVVSGDCIYSSRNLIGTNADGVYIPLGTGIGSVWDQLKTFDRINQEIAGDLNRLLILHDSDRWSRFTQVKEVEGFGIFRVV